MKHLWCHLFWNLSSFILWFIPDKNYRWFSVKVKCDWRCAVNWVGEIAKSPPRQKPWAVLSLSLCHNSWGLNPMHPQETWELSHSFATCFSSFYSIANKPYVAFFCVIQNERVDTFWKYLAEFLCEKKIIASCRVNSKGKHLTVKCVFPFLQGLSKKKPITLVWNYANHKHPKYWNPNVAFCQRKHRQLISKNHVNFV